MMFESIKPFPLINFQKINHSMSREDGLIEILKPNEGYFYRLEHIIDTTYINPLEAVYCIRNIYEHLSNTILPIYGFANDIYRNLIIFGDLSDACNYIHDVQFNYEHLNNYAREAQLIHYNRKKNFQRPDETRRSIALIGMAYVELARWPQYDFMILTAEEIARMQHGVSEYHTSEYIATGICRMVWDWRREGKTEREIAELLYDDGKWCSLAQIRALLHDSDTRISADSMKKNAARLLGKAKY